MRTNKCYVRKKIILFGLLAVLLTATGLSIYYFSPERRKTRHYNKGLLYFKQQKIDNAVQEFENALAIDPQDKEIRLQTATLYTLKRDSEKAIQALQWVIKKDPQDQRPYIGLIRIYTEQKEYKKALDVCDARLKVTPEDTAAINHRGLIKMGMGQIGLAQKEFERATQIKPKDYAGYINLAKTYSLENQNDEAVRVLEKYLQMTPDDYYVRMELAGYFMAPQDAERAYPGISISHAKIS